MKSIEESIAEAMDCDNSELVTFLSYILQDFYEIGSSAESIVKIIKENKKQLNELNVLDLGCGKGAVAIKISEELKCKCIGIDGISDFIETANSIVESKKIHNCTFLCADIRVKINDLALFDIIILGSIGPAFGNYYETMEKLKKHLKTNGIIILDDGYIDEENEFTHNFIGSKKQLIDEIDQAEMKIINEYIDEDVSQVKEYEKQFNDIVRRCNELKENHPEIKNIFDEYLRKQKEEYNNLENEIICSTMVIGRKNMA